MFKVAMSVLRIAAVAIGIGIVIDGIGSVFIRGGQYHNAWFDGERYVRAAAGVVLVVLGALT